MLKQLIDNFKSFFNQTNKDIEDVSQNNNAESVYEMLKPLDPDGMQLFKAAKQLTGIDLARHCITADIKMFENSQGEQLLDLMEKVKFDDPLNEKNFKETNEYKQFKDQLYTNTIKDIMSKQEKDLSFCVEILPKELEAMKEAEAFLDKEKLLEDEPPMELLDKWENKMHTQCLIDGGELKIGIITGEIALGRFDPEAAISKMNIEDKNKARMNLAECRERIKNEDFSIEYQVDDVAYSAMKNPEISDTQNKDYATITQFHSLIKKHLKAEVREDIESAKFTIADKKAFENDLKNLNSPNPEKLVIDCHSVVMDNLSKKDNYYDHYVLNTYALEVTAAKMADMNILSIDKMKNEVERQMENIKGQDAKLDYSDDMNQLIKSVEFEYNAIQNNTPGKIIDTNQLEPESQSLLSDNSKDDIFNIDKDIENLMNHFEQEEKENSKKPDFEL